MEIIKISDGLLTNSEVFEILSEYKKLRPLKVIPLLQNREFVENHTIQYLSSIGAATPLSTLKDKLVKIKLLGLKLTEAELLQIANSLPQYPVEIFTVSFLYELISFQNQ
jgi:hypothetical protein